MPHLRQYFISYLTKFLSRYIFLGELDKFDLDCDIHRDMGNVRQSLVISSSIFLTVCNRYHIRTSNRIVAGGGYSQEQTRKMGHFIPVSGENLFNIEKCNCPRFKNIDSSVQ